MKHTSIYSNESVKTRRCICVWVYMSFFLRTQAWQCINDKILEGAKYAYPLSPSLSPSISWEKQELVSHLRWLCCMCASSGIPTFLSFSFSRLFCFVFCCLYGNKKKMMKREEVQYSVYYLVGWFFFLLLLFRIIVLFVLHRYLFAIFFFAFSRAGSSTSDREKEKAIQ